MTRIKIAKHKPPVLGNGIYYKDIPFKDEQQFVDALTGWVKSFVSSHRAMHLVMQSPDLPELVAYMRHAPPTMKLFGPEGRTFRVTVDFQWGRSADGGWWVMGLWFSITDRVENIAAARNAVNIERLRDRAEERQAMKGPPARVLYFEAEKHSADFEHDLKLGQYRVADLISDVYGIAKELAKLPTNPIGPDPDDGQSIFFETLKGLIGAGIGGPIDALTELGLDVRKSYEIAKKAVEIGEKVAGHAKTALKGDDFNKVAALVDLVDIGVMLAKGNPLTSLGGLILGSMIDIVIANQAGAVSKVRSHMYACFVGGFMREIVNASDVKPQRPGDNVFYDYGKQRAQRLAPNARYYIQLALMHHGLTHPRPGWGLHAMFEDRPPVFPDDYIRHWSESFVEDSFMLQFCKADYLYR